MTIKKAFLTLAIVMFTLPALGAAPDGPAPRLAAVRHAYDRFGETLTFVFQDGSGRAVSSVPRPEVTYNKRKNFMRLAFEGVVSELDELQAEGAAVSSVEVRTLRGKTVAYIFLKKPVRRFFRESERTGSLTLGLYDLGGCYWVRVDAPHWRSPDAVYPFWNALKRAAITTCLLQDETGAYYLSTIADYDTPERAAQAQETAQAVIDSFVEQDLMQPSRPVASVGTVMDAAGPYGPVPEPAGELAEKIKALVKKLPDNPADIHAGMRHQRISAAMRELIKIGRPAVPALALAATSGDGVLRRTALLTLAAIGGRDVEQFLAGGLDDAEPAVRQEMALALERPPMTRAKLIALRGALQDEDKWVRFFAARALTRAWMPPAVPVIMNLLADREVREETADIIHRSISAGVSSEVFADLSEAAADKAIKRLIADWEVNRDFIIPRPALKDSFDILEKVSKHVYGEYGVRCYIDEKRGQVRMAIREKGGKEMDCPLCIVQRLAGNLDDDGAPEEVVIVGEDEFAPLRIAVLDDHRQRGSVLWTRSLGKKARPISARAYLADVDGDGVCEIILAAMSKIHDAASVTTTLYRANGDGFRAVFSAETYGEEKPKGHFDPPKETRSLMRFEPCKSGPRTLVLDVTVKTGAGGNVRTSRKTSTYTWKEGAYHMSETTVRAPSNQTGETGAPSGRTAGKVEIIIDKSDGKLRVYIEGVLKKTYDAKFGSVEGDKEIEGDRKTPEGEFYVCVKNPHSRYHLSLGLSYPNGEDAARGLRDGLITKEQYDRIVEAINRKAVPPWKTPLGGEIFIHGYSGPGKTRGCIALSDKNIEELYKIANIGTRVVIRP